MTPFTSQLRDLATLVALGNAADKAYNKGVGTPEAYKAFTAEDIASVQNNGVVPKAVASATLLLAAYREQTDEPSLSGRTQALRDIVEGNLTKVERLVVRVLANATWWGRAISRDVKRITDKDNGGDFQDLSDKEKVKDDNVADAVAAAMLAKLI